jgi:hypothetical protein
MSCPADLPEFTGAGIRRWYRKVASTVVASIDPVLSFEEVIRE